MNKFEKVSYEQFKKDCLELINSNLDEEWLYNIYCSIKLPQRATYNSAGYDFFTPFELSLDNEWLTIPTGIRWVCDEPKVLLIMPRSGQGFKYGLSLRNTIGVIDSDYCNAANEGHIMAKISVEKDCTIEQGKGFVQGIIVPFAVTQSEENTFQVRTGGFGSTD